MTLSNVLPFLFPRVSAPLTVKDRAVSFDIKYEHSEAGQLVLSATGACVREANGHMRTEYTFDVADGQGRVLLLWDPDTRTSSLTVGMSPPLSVTDPDIPHPTKWVATSPVKFYATAETMEEIGITWTRMLLEPVGGTYDATRHRSECWISKKWGLVLRDIEQDGTRTTSWKIVRIKF